MQGGERWASYLPGLQNSSQSLVRGLCSKGGYLHVPQLCLHRTGGNRRNTIFRFWLWGQCLPAHKHQGPISFLAALHTADRFIFLIHITLLPCLNLLVSDFPACSVWMLAVEWADSAMQYIGTWSWSKVLELLCGYRSHGLEPIS